MLHVNARLCEEAIRLAFFLVSQRHFDFFNYENKTSKCCKCELEM